MHWLTREMQLFEEFDQSIFDQPLSNKIFFYSIVCTALNTCLTWKIHLIWIAKRNIPHRHTQYLHLRYLNLKMLEHGLSSQCNIREAHLFQQNHLRLAIIKNRFSFNILVVHFWNVVYRLVLNIEFQFAKISHLNIRPKMAWHTKVNVKFKFNLLMGFRCILHMSAWFT